jgi:hypothetical protein
MTRERNMVDHRNSEVGKIWDVILASKPQPLSNLKGKRGESTDLYQRLFKKKGIYVIQDATGKIVCVGIAGVGGKEGALADRAWTHCSPVSVLSQRLAPLGVTVSECSITVHEEPDAKKRRRIEKYGIAVFDPPGNED